MCAGLLSEECLGKYINHQVRFARPDGERASGVLEYFGELSYSVGLSSWGWTIKFKGRDEYFFVTDRTELEYLTKRSL